METEEKIQSEMYHSFISEMSMYMSPKVHVDPEVHIYPKLSKPHAYVSKSVQTTCTYKWNFNVHVSKSTCIQKYTKLSMPHVHVSKCTYIP